MLLKIAAIIVAAYAALTPPSGRPPVGPVERYEPRVYDVRYEVTLDTAIPHRQDDPRLPRDPREKNPRLDFGRPMHLRDAPIVMPLVFRGAYHAIDPDTVRGNLWLDGHADTALARHFRIDSGLPHHTHLAVLPIERFDGKNVRWSVSYRMQSFSSRVDEAAAALIPWPRDWPGEVADGVAPQLYIESDHALFIETVERVSQGRLRLVPPYLAAKDLVRYGVENVQVEGDGVVRGRLGVLHGLELKGARETAATGRGGPHDLVCVCVALLRAAGIPARPVIGIGRNERGDKRLMTWAEFFLPDAGWVPFDPMEMRGRAVGSRDVRQPWTGFGTLDDLNRRVPLAYHFLPPRAVESPQAPALWGWDPRPEGAPPTEQRITFTVTSRGTGQPDPRPSDRSQ